MTIFKRKSPASALLDGSGTGNAYTDASAVWLERYGSYLQQAYNWRLVAILEAIGIIVAMLGLSYVAAQTKFVPYVVAVDKIGEPVGVQVADHIEGVDPRVVRAELANWISDARSVATDRVVEKQNLDRVYAMVQNGSEARGYLDTWYTHGHSPFDLANSETVSTSIDSMLPISPTTWQIQWTETVRNPQGAITATQQWAGSFGVAIHPPTDEATILTNPLGVYLTTLDWTKKI
jgi:type IV secretion system protein VirB5